MHLGLGLAITSRGTGGGGGAPSPSIQLSASTIAEDADVGDAVGTLSVVNGSGSYTFTLTDDAGGLFDVDGAALEVAGALDFETAASHSITVEADNGVDAPISRVFSITVTDEAEAEFTWNPADKHADVSLSNGNLTASKPTDTSGSGYSDVRGTVGKSADKWHFEITNVAALPTPGLANASAGLETFPGEDNNSIGVFAADGIYIGGVMVAPMVGAAPAVYAIEIDRTANLFWVAFDDGDWNEDAGADPATGAVGIDISAISGELFPIISLYNAAPTGDVATINFGASAFTRTVSDGFTAWDGGDEAGPVPVVEFRLLADGASFRLLANGTDRRYLAGSPF